jgi:putative NIF3 family GTP cyclohydrolase 1 type 2
MDDVLRAGCDTFVTADLKYNHFEEAKYRGLNLVDAGHFETENPVCGRIEAVLRAAFPGLEVLRSKNHRDETHFL